MVEPTLVMLVTQIPCNSITKRQDQYLTVRANYTYKGPAKRGRLVAWVTHETIIQEFNKIGSTEREVYVDLPAAETPQPLYTNIPNLPLTGVEPKADYGVLVRALDLDGEPEWGCKRVLTVTSVGPEINVTSLTLS